MNSLKFAHLTNNYMLLGNEKVAIASRIYSRVFHPFDLTFNAISRLKGRTGQEEAVFVLVQCLVVLEPPVLSRGEWKGLSAAASHFFIECDECGFEIHINGLWGQTGVTI